MLSRCSRATTAERNVPKSAMHVQSCCFANPKLTRHFHISHNVPYLPQFAPPPPPPPNFAEPCFSFLLGITAVLRKKLEGGGGGGGGGGGRQIRSIWEMWKWRIAFSPFPLPSPLSLLELPVVSKNPAEASVEERGIN